MERKIIVLNQKESYFVNNPYAYKEICTLDSTDMTFENLQLEHLNKEEAKEIQKIIKKYSELFFREGDNLTSTTEIEHEIRTTTEEQLNSKLYRYPPKHEEEVRKQIKEMEEQGIIRKSNSRYSSPLIVIPKKVDNSGKKKFRIVIDYRKLNEITIDDKFPLPNIDSLLDKLGRTQYFTTLD